VSEPDDTLRVSDAERDVTLRRLGDHAAVGRLTLDELEERSSRVLAAKTRGELATLTSDLPEEAGQGSETSPAPARTARRVRWMVAIMSGTYRRGRFRAVGSINVVAIMGGDEIDLREAEIEGGELTLHVFTLMGGANIYIPDSIEVDVGGLSVMGGNTEIGVERLRAGAPRVNIRAYNLMGGTTLYRVPPQARGRDLGEARRLAKAAGRGRLPPPDLPAAGFTQIRLTVIGVASHAGVDARLCRLRGQGAVKLAASGLSLRTGSRPGRLQPGCKPGRAPWRQPALQEATMANSPVIEKFLQAIETAAIPGCDAWSADATLDATVPNWRLRAAGADAIRAEYARWFTDPGHFDELRRYSVDGGEAEVVEYTLSWSENGVPHAAHHLHLLTVREDRIVADTVFCGGRWPAALLADMEAAGA
jgi:DUF1707 SHOCT-like domain/Cell wall-active antibiotics response LiaF, C-terminal